MWNFIKRNPTAGIVVIVALVTLLTYGLFDLLVEQPEPEQYKPDITEYNCLREALYFEIRSGTNQAMQNVADVVVNRVNAVGFPDTICKVVYQHKQFSYTRRRPGWDKQLAYADQQALERIEQIAFDTLVNGSKNKDLLWYHTHKSRPKWSKHMQMLEKDKDHRFFGYNQVKE